MSATAGARAPPGESDFRHYSQQAQMTNRVTSEEWRPASLSSHLEETRDRAQTSRARTRGRRVARHPDDPNRVHTTPAQPHTRPEPGGGSIWARPRVSWQNDEMRFRAGLLIGAGIGYVLGSRAGRERYEQIRGFTAEASRHPAVSQLVDQATGVVDLVRDGVAGGLTIGAKGLRTVARGNQPEAG